MRESTKRWEGSFPRKGWRLCHGYELPYGESIACDFCGTSIRFVYVLKHADVEDSHEAGCVCTEHLTEDYVRPRQVKKEYTRSKKRRDRWPTKWVAMASGTFVNKHPITKEAVTVFRKPWQSAWSYVYQGKFVYGFPTSSAAKQGALDNFAHLF